MRLQKLRQYAGLLRRIFYKGRSLPIYVICFVTSRCPNKCPHCFNWKRAAAAGREAELTLDEYEKISRTMGDLAFVFLTGGEPMLRDDLPEIARVFHKNNHVIRIQCPTSGYDPDRIIRTVERILQACPGMQYGQGISLDALGEDHSRNRGTPGLFQAAIETIRGLQKLGEKHPNLGVVVPIAVSAANQDKVLDLYRYLRSELKLANVFINYVRGQPRDPETLKLDVQRYAEIARTINDDLVSLRLPGFRHVFGRQWFNAKNVMTRQINCRTVLEERRIVDCYAGRLAGVIYENGDVFPCELLDDCLGNLRQEGYDMRRVWRSPRADAIRRQIDKHQCHCTHECFMSTNILFNPWQLACCTGLVVRMELRRAGQRLFAGR